MQKIKSFLSPGKHAGEATHVENVEQLHAPPGQTAAEKTKAPAPAQEDNEGAPPATSAAPIHSQSSEQQAALSQQDQITNYDIVRAQQTEPRGYDEDISPRSTPISAASRTGDQRGLNGPQDREYSEGSKSAAPPTGTTTGRPQSRVANALDPNINTTTSQYEAPAKPPAEPYISAPEYKEYKPQTPPKTETGQPMTRPARADEPKPAVKEEKKRRSSLLNFLRRDKSKKTDTGAEEEAKSQERQNQAEIDRQAPIGTAAATTAGAAKGAERHPAGLESNRPFPTQTQPPLVGMTGQNDAIDRSKSLTYRPRKTTDAPAFSGVLVDTRGSSIAGSSGAGSIANPPGAPYNPPGASYSAPRETSATDTGPVRVTGGAPPSSRMESSVPVGAFNWST